MSPIAARETRIERQPIQMHHEGAIRGALKGINDHRAGIPEFMKNSAGAYCRLSAATSLAQAREDRILVLLFRAPRGRGAGAVGCLDLVGMTPEDIDFFQRWFDPTAATRGDPSAELWGGHGNGAKSYMLRMFGQRWFASMRDRRYTRMGWLGGESYQIGYIPSRSEAGGVRVSRPLDLLEEMLQVCFKASVQALPNRARETLGGRPCWTLFVGIDAKDWVSPNRLLELLEHNPQALRSIEYCNVYALIDGILALDGRPLDLEPIQPMPSGESPYEIDMPRLLNDPDGGSVDTTVGGRYPPGKLILRTSMEPMLYTLKHRHVIRCESAAKGVVGLYPVVDLAGRFADHIYGELYLEAMQEYETNFRSRPHEAPLTRAVEAWLRQQVTAYANRFREQEQDRHTDEERNELRQLNEDMNRFLERFLEEVEAEAGSSGEGGGAGLTGTGRGALPQGEVALIQHNLSEEVNLCGENVSVYVRLEFFDPQGIRVRPVPVHWETSDPEVAYAQLGSLIAGRPGECQVWAVAENGVRSSPIRLRVLKVDSIEVTRQTAPLPVGSRMRLEYAVSSGGTLYADVKLDWHSSNEEFVKVGSNTGVVTATAGPSIAEVWASAYGVQSNRVQIQTSGEGAGGAGPHFPTVLLSEINEDPDTGRPKRIDPDAGTVVQDVADRRRNIYWVNMRSPLADPFYRGEGGVSYRSPEFRMYLAERYAEVVFRDALARGDQWEPGDVEELLRERPTRLRQALAGHLQEWLSGEWHLG